MSSLLLFNERGSRVFHGEVDNDFDKILIRCTVVITIIYLIKMPMWPLHYASVAHFSFCLFVIVNFCKRDKGGYLLSVRMAREK